MTHSKSVWSACTVTGLAIKTEPVTLHAGKISSPKLIGTLTQHPQEDSDKGGNHLMMYQML